MSDDEGTQYTEIEVKGYQFEPTVDRHMAEEDPYVQMQMQAEADEIYPVKEWCSCGKCQLMPTAAQNVCCADHDARHKMGNEKCITDHNGIYELTRPAVLEVAYQNYKCYHDDLFDAVSHTANTKNRFCAYRFLAFWIYPELRRKERKPLPACLYSYIQAMFPPTDDEEEFAEWEFSKFVYGDEDE